MTSCSLTRIEGLLRVRVAGEGYTPFYRTFAVSPSISMLSLADAQAWEPRASRDATDQDARYRYQYYLTPTCVSEMELEEPSLAELARVIKAGACIEASFKRGKGEVGMDAYQVRTWPGWHHHMALSLMAVWFLIGETHRGQQLTPALTLPQVRYGLSLLLLEVFCTPGVDYICRQVHRQLMRNELARFYHHRTRKCIPRRSYAERYSRFIGTLPNYSPAREIDQ